MLLAEVLIGIAVVLLLVLGFVAGMLWVIRHFLG